MSMKKQIILLESPQVIQADRPETFTVDGFSCPECKGQGWHWAEDGADYTKVPCKVCGGTGEICAEVTVNWRPSWMEKDAVKDEICAHLEGIIKVADRMTSGNFMHNRASLKLSAQIVLDRLQELGIKRGVE